MASPGGSDKPPLDAIRHVARIFLDIGRMLKESTPQYQPEGRGVHFIVPDDAAPPVCVILTAEAEATLASARHGDQPARMDVWLEMRDNAEGPVLVGVRDQLIGTLGDAGSQLYRQTLQRFSANNDIVVMTTAMRTRSSDGTWKLDIMAPGLRPE
jgi:hypothetical protein